MVWFDVVWCGVVWCGVVWCGVMCEGRWEGEGKGGGVSAPHFPLLGQRKLSWAFDEGRRVENLHVVLVAWRRGTAPNLGVGVAVGQWVLVWVGVKRKASMGVGMGVGRVWAGYARGRGRVRVSVRVRVWVSNLHGCLGFSPSARRGVPALDGYAALRGLGTNRCRVGRIAGCCRRRSRTAVLLHKPCLFVWLSFLNKR